MELTWLPPSGNTARIRRTLPPGRPWLVRTSVIRLLPTSGRDASRARYRPGLHRGLMPGETWTLGGGELLFHQADHPVVVAAAAVDDAEAVTLAVVEQVEVMTDELHLEQGLVDGHRAGRVHLLAQDQRAVALHLDRDQAALGFGLIRVGAFVGVAGPGPRDPMAVHVGSGRRGARTRTRRGLRHRAGQYARRPDRDGVLDLAPVGGTAQAGLELGEGQVQRGVPVVRGRLGP